MADRTFQQSQGSLVKGVVKLWARVSIGATGACTLKAWDVPSKAYATAPSGGTQGVKSITRTGTGAYTIVLQDPYQRVLGVNATIFNATGKLTPVTCGVLDASDVTVPATGIQVQFNSATGTGSTVDPVSGDSLLFELTLANSNSL